jgi:hypothetical protein
VGLLDLLVADVAGQRLGLVGLLAEPEVVLLVALEDAGRPVSCDEAIERQCAYLNRPGSL